MLRTQTGWFTSSFPRKGLLGRLMAVGVAPALALDAAFLCYPHQDHVFTFTPRSAGEERDTLQVELLGLPTVRSQRDWKDLACAVCDQCALGAVPSELLAVILFRDWS